jgi:alpha-galactosidase/6-phospho-beta-glucosidase family protein
MFSRHDAGGASRPGLYCGVVSTQVTIVGGGSYQWGPELMADLFGTPALAGMHLVLQDIDPAPLPKMEALAGKLNDALDAKATVATTTDLGAALDGAHFVIVCISTGGFRSMTVDLDVPAQHGITQTVGDTVGPGGINRSLRNIPVLVGIGKAMEQHCPDAWLFNITNPMTCLTRAVCRETNIKTVGLCHEVGNFCMDLAIACGRPFESVTCSVTGINHFPVLTALEVDGAEGFDVLRKLVDEVGGLESLRPSPDRPEAEKFSKRDFAERHLFKLTLLDRWGTFPAAGDRHIAEFVSFALTPESEWGAAYNIGLSPISRREQHQAEYVADVDAWLAGTKDLQTWQSGELPSPMIQAMLSGEPFEAPVNIPNAGQGVGLPPDAVLESICVIDGDGIRGRDRSVLPPPYDEIVRRHVATQELTVEAALRGDRRLAGEAFALDPLAGRGDLRVTESMVDELLAGTAEWLPQFA